MRNNRQNHFWQGIEGCLLFLLLGLLLQGCTGFKPRAAESMVSTSLKGLSVYIDSNGIERSFLKILRAGLNDSGATLVEESTPLTITLKILDLEEDKTVSAYSSVRQVREFNHYIELDYLATRGAVSAPEQRVSSSVRAERAQIYDSRYVLGVSAEERSIRDELRAEAVRLMALRLNVLR